MLAISLVGDPHDVLQSDQSHISDLVTVVDSKASIPMSFYLLENI